MVEIPSDPIDQLKAIIADAREVIPDRQKEMAAMIGAINQEFSCHLEVSLVACPVQVEGDLHGYGVYLRARWDNWYFAVADTVDAAAGAKWGMEPHEYFYRQGDVPGDFEASWMEASEVGAILHRCIQEFVGEFC